MGHGETHGGTPGGYDPSPGDDHRPASKPFRFLSVLRDLCRRPCVANESTLERVSAKLAELDRRTSSLEHHCAPCRPDLEGER